MYTAPCPKAGGRFLSRCLQRHGQLFRSVHGPDAFAATPGRCLDEDRVADSGGLGLCPGLRRQFVRSRYHRQTGFLHHLPGPHLVSHQPYRLGSRSHPGYAGVLTGFREVRIFGQEAVSRVDGVYARFPDDVKDIRRVQVALLGRGGPYEIRLVGVAHVERVAIRLRVDGDGGDVHLTTGTNDAEGDLAAIGYEELLEHRCADLRSFYPRWRLIPQFRVPCIIPLLGRQATAPGSRLDGLLLAGHLGLHSFDDLW